MRPLPPSGPPEIDWQEFNDRDPIIEEIEVDCPVCYGYRTDCELLDNGDYGPEFPCGHCNGTGKVTEKREREPRYGPPPRFGSDDD